MNTLVKTSRRRPYDYQWLNGHALYSPAEAEEAAEHIANGHSLRAAAGAIHLPFASIMRWLAEIPDFARRIDIAAARRVFELEKRVLVTKDGVKAKVLLLALRRAAPEAWDDPRTSPHDEGNQLPQTVVIQVIASPKEAAVKGHEGGGETDSDAVSPPPAVYANGTDTLQ